MGEFYEVAETKDIVYIGRDLPDEYAHSEYTRILKGANSKAKANAAQGIPELIENAYNRKHKENRKEKKSINLRLQMVGIVMIQDLLCLYMVIMMN